MPALRRVNRWLGARAPWVLRFTRGLVRPALRAFTNREIRRFARGRRTFGERHADAPLLVLTTVGRRSGLERRTPLVYLTDGEDWIISGGAGGVPWTPDWVLNLRASGSARIEVTPGQDVAVRATELDGADWDAWWRKLRRALPLAESYQRRMDRRVPIFRLTLQPKSRPEGPESDPFSG